MDWKKKLTSRKFWTAVASFVTLIASSFGMQEVQAAQVTAIIMAGATVIAYIIGEGFVDAAHSEAAPGVPTDASSDLPGAESRR